MSDELQLAPPPDCKVSNEMNECFLLLRIVLAIKLVLNTCNVLAVLVSWLSVVAPLDPSCSQATPSVN